MSYWAGLRYEYREEDIVVGICKLVARQSEVGELRELTLDSAKSPRFDE